MSPGMGIDAIAWIGGPAGPEGWAAAGGQWGAPEQLGIALNDRGLLLADGLFETVLIEQGKPQLLQAHLARWHRSAVLLQMPTPPGADRVRELVQAAVERSGIESGALRLNWSRGGGGRGIDVPGDGGSPQFWLQLSATRPSFSPITAIVSPTERRCATSLLSRCKTFAYGNAIQARRQAQQTGAHDALLESSAGGLCCGTTANLLLEIGGRWYTPPLNSGCLPGVMRQRALEQGLVAEASEPIGLPAVAGGRVGAAWLINSLGCRPLLSLNGHPLARCDAAQSERFWRRLLPS